MREPGAAKQRNATGENKQQPQRDGARREHVVNRVLPAGHEHSNAVRIRNRLRYGIGLLSTLRTQGKLGINLVGRRLFFCQVIRVESDLAVSGNDEDSLKIIIFFEEIFYARLELIFIIEVEARLKEIEDA